MDVCLVCMLLLVSLFLLAFHTPHLPSLFSSLLPVSGSERERGKVKDWDFEAKGGRGSKGEMASEGLSWQEREGERKRDRLRGMRKRGKQGGTWVTFDWEGDTTP